MSGLHQSILNLEQYIAGTFKPTNKYKTTYGLCGNVIDDHVDTYEHFESWEHFSGSPNYPVEGNGTDYDNTTHRRNDRRTKFGKLRLDLAKHLLKELKREEDNEKIRIYCR